MANEMKPHWVGAGVLLTPCPRCGTKGRFEQISPREMILNDCLEDEFTIESIFGSTRQYLHPPFVCRNVKCDFVAVIQLPPVKV